MRVPCRQLALAILLAATCSSTVVAVPGKNTAGRRAREVMEQREEARRQYNESIRPRQQLIAPSPNHVIGKVVRINDQEGFLVGWLHSRYINLTGSIVTRDSSLRQTAFLTAGTARSGRAASFRILSGAPSIGDEVVIITPVFSAAEKPATPQSETAAPAPSAPAPTKPAKPDARGNDWLEQADNIIQGEGSRQVKVRILD